MLQSYFPCLPTIISMANVSCIKSTRQRSFGVPKSTSLEHMKSIPSLNLLACYSYIFCFLVKFEHHILWGQVFSHLTYVCTFYEIDDVRNIYVYL